MLSFTLKHSAVESTAECGGKTVKTKNHLGGSVQSIESDWMLTATFLLSWMTVFRMSIEGSVMRLK